jgi:hypothetical protein
MNDPRFCDLADPEAEPTDEQWELLFGAVIADVEQRETVANAALAKAAASR